MRLRLKEDPSEWRKFALALAAFGAAIAGVGLGRAWISGSEFQAILLLPIGVLVIALVRVGWLRPLYRGAMTASFHVGQVVGRVLLVVLFFLVLTPLGLALRLGGRDLLGLRRRPPGASYWQAARPETPLDRLF